MDTELEDVDDMVVSCILRFRDRVMGPIFVMETPEEDVGDDDVDP